MLDAGVIVPVTEPTPWINSFVIVETTDQHGNTQNVYLSRSNPSKQGSDQGTLSLSIT